MISVHTVTTRMTMGCSLWRKIKQKFKQWHYDNFTIEGEKPPPGYRIYGNKETGRYFCNGAQAQASKASMIRGAEEIASAMRAVEAKQRQKDGY